MAAKDAVDGMKGLTAADKAELKLSAVMGGSVGDVESSYAFQRMTANLVTGKARANVDLDRAYDQTVSAPIVLAPTAGAPAPPVAMPDAAAVKGGTKLKVLGRKGPRVQVRDDAGNEGWLDEAQLIAR